MLTLIRKDLLLHKMAFLGFAPMLVFFLGWLATQIRSQNAFVVFACIYATLIPMVFIAREDKFGADAFVCSLPVTRRQVARAKFLLSWAVALIFAVASFAIYAALAPDGGSIWSLAAVGRVVVVLTLLLAVLLPFLLRFGWMGLIIGMVGAQVLGIVAFLTVKYFKEQIRLRDVFASISTFFENAREQFGSPLYLAGVVFALIIINVISYYIALALYERREL